MDLSIVFYDVESPDSYKEPPYKSKPIKTSPVMGQDIFFFIPRGAKCGEITVTLDPKYLFSNQFNTMEGHRIFDHVILETAYGNKGYWLSLDSKRALDSLREITYVCGFCNKQYPKEEAYKLGYFCNNCLESEYLERSDLPLTRLLPIKSGGLDHHSVRKTKETEIPSWLEVQYNQRQRETLIKMKRKYLERQHKRIKSIEMETEVMADVYNRGLNPQKLHAIYYDHKDELVFNATSYSGLPDNIIDFIKRKMEGFNKCEWSIKEDS